MLVLFFKFLILCLGSLPIRIRAILGRALGIFVALFLMRERKVATLQLKYLLGSPDPSWTAFRVFGSIGESLFESLNLKPYLNRKGSALTIIGKEWVAEATAQRRPLVALTGHTGNWDLMAAHMVSLGVPLATAARPSRYALVQSLLSWFRERYGVKVLWRTKGGGAKAIVSQFVEKNTVAALIDQDTRVSSIFVPFFGVPARTPSGLITLARKHNAILVSALNYRTAVGRYVIEIEPFAPDLTLEEIAILFNQRLEVLIRKYPEQWVWFHKRWRSSPIEGALTSAQYLERLSSGKMAPSQHEPSAVSENSRVG